MYANYYYIFFVILRGNVKDHVCVAFSYHLIVIIIGEIYTNK